MFWRKRGEVGEGEGGGEVERVKKSQPQTFWEECRLSIIKKTNSRDLEHATKILGKIQT